MLKSLIVLGNLIGIFLISLFLSDEMTITDNFPESLKIGESQVVTVNINKSGVQGFAKYQIEVPGGLQIKPLELHGASFTFKDGKAKFIWMNLPSASSFDIQYEVKLDNGEVGKELEVNSKMSYLVNNNRQIHQGPNHLLLIQSEDEQVAATQSTSSTEITATRKIVAEGNNTYLVEIEVNKIGIKGFAKIQDVLPEGFVATEVMNNEAIFTFTKNKVKLVWFDIPKAMNLKLAYQIQVPEDFAGTAEIEGKFHYMAGSDLKKIDIPKRSISVNENLADNSNNANNTTNTADNNTSSSTGTINTTNTTDNTSTSDVADNTKSVEDNTNSVIDDLLGGSTTNTTDNATNVADNNTTNVQNQSGSVVNDLTQTGSDVADNANDVANNTTNNVQNQSGSVVNDLTQTGSDAVDSANDVANNTSNNVQNQSGSVVNDLTQTGSNTVDNASDVADNTTNTVQNQSGSTVVDKTVTNSNDEPTIEDRTNSVVDQLLGGNSNDANNNTSTNTASTDDNTNNNNNVDEITYTTVTDRVDPDIADNNTSSSNSGSIDNSSSSNTTNSSNANNVSNNSSETENNNGTSIAQPESTAVAVTQYEKDEVLAESNRMTNISNVSQPDRGITYRVQIMAGKKVVGKEYLKKRHNFRSQFTIENHEGWIKYTTGTYPTYKGARDHRNSIRNSYNFDGPFVSAYNDGVRITVQEALMITKQQWYN